jgi:hypothetical protein
MISFSRNVTSVETFAALTALTATLECAMSSVMIETEATDEHSVPGDLHAHPHGDELLAERDC